MGLVFDHMTFDGHAPDLHRIAAKMTEICGLAVVVTESDAEVKGTLHDTHGTLAFAAAPEEQITLFSYRTGAVKEFYAEYSEGLEGIKLPTERFVTGLHEPQGTQAVYLSASVGHEPTLFMVTVLALEALGGKPREPITEDIRREYGVPITLQDLRRRQRKMRNQVAWAALLFILCLPLTIPLFVLGILFFLVMLPWRLMQAVKWYHDAVAVRDHKSLIARLPDVMEFVPTSPDAFSQLEHATLKRYTQELQALGFVHWIDYTVRADARGASGGFARLCYHPEHHCIAEINQAITDEGLVSTMRCMFGSLLSDGWDLTTTDREPTDMTMSYAWRRPKALWACHPRLSLAELLTEHLRRRRMMIIRLAVNVVKDLTQEGFFEYERRTMAERKEVLRLKNYETIQMEMERFERSPVYEWSGDFGLESDVAVPT